MPKHHVLPVRPCRQSGSTVRCDEPTDRAVIDTGGELPRIAGTGEPLANAARTLPRRAIGVALATAMAAVTLPLAAAPAETLSEGTPACAQALADVDAREAAVRAARRDDPSAAGRPDARLVESRRRAARACLGPQAELGTPERPAAAAPSRRPPAARGPVVPGPPAGQASVPPLPPVPESLLRPDRSVVAPAPAAHADSVAPRAPPAPLTVGACDPGGCWASDGSRLQRVGPQLLGPRGFCTQQGAFLHCL
jgi:hypothetical protein